MLTDEQLLVDYARGDQSAFAELVRRYEQELFAFLARFVADKAAAEDLFQETFIQVHRSAHTFDAERRFRPWIFTIAANKARDHLRATGRHVMRSLDGVVGKGAGDTGFEGTTFVDLMDSGYQPPPGELQAAEDVTAVQHVLEALPAHYREVLIMSYFHQFAYKEMAQMLGIPLGTVKSRLHAALAAFARSFKSHDG